MRRFRRLLSPLLLLALAAACDGDPSGSRPGPPARMEIVSGDGQQKTVGSTLDDPLVVEVLDAGGDPVPGVAVNFVVTAGGGSLLSPTASTDANGRAQNRWTLGTAAGVEQRVEARVLSGSTTLTREFTATGTAANPDALSAVGATTLNGTAGDAFDFLLRVRVVDQYGNPVPGMAVTWEVVAGGGTVTALGSTDGDGIAQADWKLGTRVGPGQRVRATVAGESVTFQATAAVPPAATIELIGGGGQTGQVGTALADSLVVRVRHADGRALENAAVTWVANAASGSFSGRTKTGADGRAAAAWTLPRTAGEATATVRLGGTGKTATATATAERGPPFFLGAVGDGGIWLYAGIAKEVEARLTDRYGNPVAGEVVGWANETGTVDPASSVTNEEGIARTQWTETVVGERRRLVASSPVIADTAWFRGRVFPGPAAEVRLSGAPVTVGVGSVKELAVTVFDAYGNQLRADRAADITIAFDDPAVATVTDVLAEYWIMTWTVTVRGEAPGSTPMHVYHGNTAATTTVTVPPPPP